MAVESTSIAALALSSCTIVWQVFQFSGAVTDAKNRDFDASHRLVKELVQPGDGGATYVHRQCAVVFEMRRFKQYEPLTLRLLTDIKATWGERYPIHPALESELRLALEQLRR